MAETPEAITSEDLQAYVDDELRPARRAEVAAFLVEDAEAAAEVATHEWQKALDRGAFDDGPEEPQPPVLKIRSAGPRPWIVVVAALAVLILGGTSGWLLQGTGWAPWQAPLELADRTLTVYEVYQPEERHAVEVTVAKRTHLAVWLSKRLGMTFRVPRLSTLGFGLLGGRLMAGPTGPAAMLMYEDQEKHRLVLYVRNDMSGNRETGFRYRREADVGVLYWIDGSSGFGLSGELDEAELTAAAHVVRAQFEL